MILVLLEVLLVASLAGCGGGGPFSGSISPVAGRVAGSITIAGPVPVTTSPLSADWQSDIKLAVYPAGRDDQASIVASYDLPELGEALLGTNGTAVLDFQLDDIPAGDYRFGLYRYAQWGEPDSYYQTFWFSTIFSLNADQVGLVNLQLAPEFFTGQETGTISGRIPLSGSMVTGDRLLVFERFDDTDYIWPVTVDAWNRLEFEPVSLPADDYALDMVGLSADFYLSLYTEILGYQAQVKAGQPTTVGFVNNTVYGNGLDQTNTAGLSGEVLFAETPDTSRDTLVSVTIANGPEPPYDHYVVYLNPASLKPTDNNTWGIGYTPPGEYTVRVLSLGESVVDVVDLGGYDSFHLFDETSVNYEHHSLGKLVIGDHCDVSGTLELAGPLPANESYHSWGIWDAAGLILAAYPQDELGWHDQVVKYVLLTEESAPVFADADGVRTLEFSLPGLPVGIYKLGIYHLATPGWSSEDYYLYWQSEPLTITADQPDITDLVLQANCMGDPPYGSLTGRLYLSGNDPSHVPQIKLEDPAATGEFADFTNDYYWDIPLDRWNRADLNMTGVPVGEYTVTLPGCKALINFTAESAADLGTIRTANASLDSTGAHTAVLFGSLALASAPDPARDYMVVAENVNPAEIHSLAVAHLDTDGLSGPATLGFGLGYLYAGEYNVRALSVGADQDDVVELAAWAGPIVVNQAAIADPGLLPEIELSTGT